MRKILSKLKRIIFGEYFQKRTFYNGVNEFESTGVTPERAYHAMINLYCSTNGKFNEDYQRKIQAEQLPAKMPLTVNGFLGTFDKADFESIDNKLNEDGYIKFKNKIPQAICSSLYNYALENGARVPPKYDTKVIYNPLKPIAEIYRFDMDDLINNKDIQSLMMDPVIINIARNYFGSEPVFDFPAMWWSATFSKEASSEAAQLYHFDMDRIKWLKIFIYLNDVGMDNGPHSYIRGSHKIGAKPRKILKRGYVRVEDAELVNFYNREDIITLTGEAGVMFAGDTKCWHKGNPLKKGERLVLEFQFASSLFGTNYPQLVANNYSEEFKTFCNNNRVYASKISFK